MILNYSEFLALRRDLVLDNNKLLAPIVDYKLFSDGSYKISLVTPERLYVQCDVAEAADITDFETNRKSFCKKLNKYDSPELPSHDYCDKTTWGYGDLNSLWVYSVDTGKVLYPASFLSIMDKDISFSAQQEMRVVLWQTVDGTTVPALHNVSSDVSTGTSTTVFDVDDGSKFVADDLVSVGLSGGIEYAKVLSVSSNTVTLTTASALTTTPSADDVITITNPTEYGVAPFYNPGGGTYTGWYEYHNDDNLQVWIYFDTNVAKYKATAFHYPDLESVYKSAHFTETISNTLKATFDYMSKGINVSFCHCINERIEIYNIDHTELTNPNNIAGLMRILFRSYDEW